MNGRSISVLFVALALLRTAPALAQPTERLYQDACDGGDFTACNVFGLMNETGQGVPRDLVLAASLYQRACEGGELVGCANVGLLHASGSGLPRDTEQAVGFFRIACEGGEALGCGLLRALEEAQAVEPVARHDKIGRVGDALSNRPLPDAIIELPGLGIRVLSDADGRFALAGFPAGTHAIRAERLGYEALLGTVHVPGDPRFVMLMTPAEIADRDAPGQIVGQVLEEAERGLSNVEVSVVGQERARTLSNAQGRFTLRDVEPGVAVVRFARLGYAPRSATLVVQAGRTAEVAATMAVQPIELEPVEVSIRSRDLERDGFYRRAVLGWGTHFTPGEIERRQPARVSDLFWGVPGIRLSPLENGQEGYALVTRRSSSFTRGSCNLAIYLDGVQLFEHNVDRIPAHQVMAAEVYTGVGTPVQYDQSGCGALLLWTRRGN